MENFKVIVNHRVCPFRQRDFKENYCTHPDRNRADKNGWDTCSLPVCPSVYQPSNTRMQTGAECSLCHEELIELGSNFCMECGTDLRR